uniref:Uncharacterized protein n=1 Tax=Latimeria chalumnae TaxID=7897 RepID=H2ZSC0_LATCH
RRPKEPPLDKGWLPWLGHVLEFRRDTARFLKGMQRKHGDIFTVQIAGYYFTFLMDPLSFGAVVKEARSKLDFNKFARELVVRVFGYHAMENEHKHLQATSTKHLMGDGLVVMTQAMMENLQNLMLHELEIECGVKAWKQEGLFYFSYNIVFRAGYLALFGNEPIKDRVHSEELFHEFRKYDRLFPRLAYAVLPPKDKLEAERLKRLFWNMVS